METKWLRDRRDQELITWANRSSIQYANWWNKKKDWSFGAYLNELKPHLELADKVILADQMKLRNRATIPINRWWSGGRNSMLATD